MGLLKNAGESMVKIICILQSALLLFGGCSSVTPELDPKVYYMRDVKLKVGERKSLGVITAAHAYRHKIEYEFPGEGDLVTFTTCHQERVKEKIDRKGHFWYVPRKIEDLGCPVNISAFEYEKGRHSWGFVAFEHPSLKLKANIRCNGQNAHATGVYACQSREGLKQFIGFLEPVTQAPNDDCPTLPGGESQFEYNTPNRECIYVFKGKESGELFTLYTIGYEEILVRDL